MNNGFTTSSGYRFKIDCDGDIVAESADGEVLYYVSEQDLEEMLVYIKQYKLTKSNNQEPRFTERGKNDKF